MENPVRYWRRNLTTVEFAIWILVAVLYTPVVFLRWFHPASMTLPLRMLETVLPLFVMYLAFRARRREAQRR